MGRDGNGDVADLTLRLLREMRAQMATKDDLARLATKEELARLATKEDLARLEKRLESRIDVLARIVKDSHRVLAKRIRVVEIRAGAHRPR